MRALAIAAFAVLLAAAPDFDLIVFAGDALDIGSSVDFRAQIVVVKKYLTLLSGLTRETAPAPDVSERLDMRRALECLPRGQRLCLVLRHGMDLSESEVADVLQISIGTVKSQTFKGIRRLRQLLEQQA